MFNPRRVFAFWAALMAIVASSGSADAQTALGLKITKNGITHTSSRGSTRSVTTINHADCVNNDVMTFPFTLTGSFSGYALQAWVGSNCTDATVRGSTTQTQCWLVANTTPSSASVGSTVAGSLSIAVSSMVSGYTTLFGTTTSSAGSAGSSGAGGTSGSGGTAGNATSAAGGATAGSTSSGTTTSSVGIGQLVEPDAAYCEPPNPLLVQGSTQLTLYIMLISSSDRSAAASDQWVGTFKLVGPPAPDNVDAGVGGNLLVVNFSYKTQPADTTGNGFNVYCDPAPGRDAATDAGLLEGDAGVGMGVCADVSPKVLFQNDPAPDGKYLCGSGAKGSGSANAKNLVNGVPYNVAVAAFDTFENVGPLSATTCEVPQPITGFFQAYRDAGGKAGGGFCSFSRNRQPFCLLSVLGVASFFVLRRRRAA